MTTPEILFLSFMGFIIVASILYLKYLDAYDEKWKKISEELRESRLQHSGTYNDDLLDFYPDIYPDVHYDIHQHITLNSPSPNLTPMSSRFLDVEVHEPIGKVMLDGIDSTINLFGDILSGKI